MKVKGLTEGAVLLAAFIILLLFTLYVPVLGSVINFVLPLPFIMFSLKNKWTFSIIFLIAASLLSMIAGTLLSVPFTLAYGMTGTAIGLLIKAGKSRDGILAGGTIVFLFNIVALYIISKVFFKIDVIEESIRAAEKSVEIAMGMAANFGQADLNSQMASQLEAAWDTVSLLVPSLFVIISFLIVLIIQLVCFPILRRFGFKIAGFGHFKDLNIPKVALWLYLVVMLAQFIFQPEAGSFLLMVVLNFFFIIHLLLVIQGLSFIFFYFSYKEMPKAFSIMAAIVTFLIPFFLSLVGILGIIDLGYGLKNRIASKKL